MSMKIVKRNMEERCQRMTSLEIAEVTGKRHADLMRAIRTMEDAWETVNGCKFALVDLRQIPRHAESDQESGCGV